MAVRRCSGRATGSAWISNSLCLSMVRVFSAELIHFSGCVALAEHFSPLQFSAPQILGWDQKFLLREDFIWQKKERDQVSTIKQRNKNNNVGKISACGRAEMSGVGMTRDQFVVKYEEFAILAHCTEDYHMVVIKCSALQYFLWNKMKNCKPDKKIDEGKDWFWKDECWMEGQTLPVSLLSLCQ